MKPLRDRPQARWLFSQFALPRGLLGSLAGAIMARGNADMARLTLDMLQPEPAERVLEIGFGPGVAIELLAEHVTAGLVAGVDPSQVMLNQAVRRNRQAIVTGRIDLRLGSSDHIPWADGTFDRACSINNVMLWNLRTDVREVRRVLRQAGRLVIAVHKWTLGGESGGLLRLGATFPSLEGVVQALEGAAFRDLDVRRLPTRSGPAVFVVAQAS